MNTQEIITVRKNRSVINRYDVLIERGNNKHRLEIGLTELNAAQIAKNVAKTMGIPLVTKLREQPPIN